MWDGKDIMDEVKTCNEREITSYFLKYLPKDDNILEAGCGLGAWVVFLREKGYRISGIDNDKKVIERLRHWDPALDVSCGTIDRLAYADCSLGSYISLGVVEHFEEGAQRPLKEAFRVLKPGGILILTVPYNNFFRKTVSHFLRDLYLLWYRLRGYQAHFAEYRYDEDEVIKMVEEAGFEIIETGMDDFSSRTRSLTLWSEFPFLRDRHGLYLLNRIGRAFAYMMNSVSRKILTPGVLIIARRPYAQQH